jgi:hypothetical protein
VQDERRRGRDDEEACSSLETEEPVGWGADGILILILMSA